MVGFSDSFWDKDPVGNTGYEIIIKRLKDGKKMCDDFSDFLRLRAKVEDEYGKNLIRIAQQAGGSEEIGTLRESWDKLKRETEMVGFSHCDLAKKLDDVDRALKAFREEQKNERLKIDDKMRRIQKDKKNTYDNVLKTRKQYEQRCKEFDAATETLESISTYTPKEEEKLRNKKAKAKTAQESSDQQYQGAIRALEQMHSLWEKEMEVSCEQFQSLEEQRIRYLRNEMWLYTNLGSQMSVDEDKLYEDVRVQLEKCDDAKDIAYFIHNKQSGSERPVPLKYENYYHPQAAIVMSAELPKPKHLSLGRSQPNLPHSSSSSPSPKERHSFSPDDKDSSYASVQEIMSDPFYTANKQDSGKARSYSELVQASFDYRRQAQAEMSLKTGDIIEVIEIEDKEWARGRNQQTGETGVFPIAFVQKYHPPARSSQEADISKFRLYQS